MRRFFVIIRSLAALCLIWQGAVWLFSPPRYILPSVQDVAGVFIRQPRFLLDNSITTLTEMVLGFISGSILGALSAFAIAALPRLSGIIWPVLLMLQALPVFVIAPLLVLWFGFGMTSKVVMATIVIFFPVASAFADGLRRVDRDILDATALTGASHWQTLVHIRLPLAMPGLLTGLRVAAPLAPLAAVIGEWVGASSGLGFMIAQANARMQTDVVFAAMAIIAALSLALRGLVEECAHFFAPWASEKQ